MFLCEGKKKWRGSQKDRKDRKTKRGDLVVQHIHLQILTVLSYCINSAWIS